ncbi:MAG TPA: hypothetical protein VF765_25925 [Polyangiaceae bacterium]
MTRQDRPTLAPGFDMEQYARESDARLRAQPAHDGAPEVQAAENLDDADAEQIYRARIGDMRQVVVLARKPEDLLHLRHGVADGFVLSAVDGRRSVEDLLRDCGLPPLAALSTLFELLETGVLALRPH